MYIYIYICICHVEPTTLHVYVLSFCLGSEQIPGTMDKQLMPSSPSVARLLRSSKSFGFLFSIVLPFLEMRPATRA